jgi:hypothetical protein
MSTMGSKWFTGGVAAGTFSFAEEFPDYRYLRWVIGTASVRSCDQVFDGGKNLLWVAKQHGHSVTTMLRIYTAWAEGAIEADIRRSNAR